MRCASTRKQTVSEALIANHLMNSPVLKENIGEARFESSDVLVTSDASNRPMSRKLRLIRLMEKVRSRFKGDR